MAEETSNYFQNGNRFMFFRMFLLLLLIFCGSLSLSAATDAKKIKLQLNSYPLMMNAGFYIASEKGFYRDAGLDVEFIAGNPQSSPASKVISGQAQYGVQGASLIYERAIGKPVIALAAILHDTPKELICLKKSGITNVSEIKGKRVMIKPLPRDPELWAMLMKYGVKPSNVNLVNIETGVTSLYEGATDVISGYVNYDTSILKQAALSYVTFEPSLLDIHFYGNIIFTTDDYARKNPDEIKAFVHASLRGWEYVMANMNESVKLLHDKYIKSSPENIKEHLAILKGRIKPPLTGEMSTSECNRIADFYVSAGLLPQNYNLTGFILPIQKNIDVDYLYYHWEAPSLNPEEREWLANHPNFNVLVMRNPPYSDWIDDAPSGILSEYLLAAAYKYNLPLTFLYQRRGIRPKPLSEYDLITFAQDTSPQDNDFTPSLIMLKVPCAIYGLSHRKPADSLSHYSNKTIGILGQVEFENSIKAHNPDVKFETFETPERAFDALISNRIAAIAASTYVMNWYITKANKLELRQEFILNGVYNKVYVAVNKSQPLLLSIINKAVKSMPVQLHGAIYNNWFGKMTSFPHDLSEPRRFGPFPPWFLDTGWMLVLLTLVPLTYLLIDKHRQRKRISIHQKNEKRMEMLLETMDDAVILSDLENWRIIDCNSATIKLYGYSKEEFTRMNITEIETDPDLAHKITRNSNAETIRRRHRCKNGKIITVSVHNSRVFFEGKNYLVTVASDISGIVQVEHAARKQEENFKVTLNSIGDAVVTTNTEGKIIIMNPVAEALSGITLREGYGHHVNEVIKLFDPITKENMPCPLEAVFRSNKIISISDNLALHSLTGQDYRIIISAAPIHDEKQNHLGSVMVIRDITAEYHRNEELKLWAERLNTAADAAEFGIWECSGNEDEPFKIVVNDNWRKLYELPSNVDNILEYWKSGLYDSDREQTIAAFETAMAGHSSLFIREIRFVLPGGRLKWIYTLNKVVSTNNRNAPLRLIGIHQDITARKNSEEQLIIARQAAETANQAKGQFIATMSHEIRTPMNGIIGFIELLQGTILDQDQMHYCTVALKSCYTLLNLLNDILDFARIDTGHMTLHPDNFNMRQLLMELRDTISTLLHKKPVELVFNLPHNLPNEVVGDQTRIRQVLTNLLSNAVKFTDTGKIELELSVIQGEHDALFCFKIKDSGIGIDPGELSKIFDKFHQIDGSSIRKYGGTGLGLSICRELALLMNGDIEVSSTVGSGSVFTFKLPLSIVAGETELPAELPQKNADQYQLLIVEDNRLNQMVIRQQLKKHGFNSDLAEDGLEAVEMTKKHKYDLIFLDCLMPKMDGFETASYIRQHDMLNRETPIVALTADAIESSFQKCIRAGMNDYLVKPVKTEDLLNMVARYLKKK